MGNTLKDLSAPLPLAAQQRAFVRPRTRRTVGGRGRTAGPSLRPQGSAASRAGAGPRLASSRGARACLAAGSKSPRAGWRLTDRGLAVVTVLIGVVVVAAVAVVALTAWRVTDDGFVPAGSSVAVQR